MAQGEEELARLRAEARDDRRLIRRAAETLAEIDRGEGLSDAHADVLAQLRIRLEGRKRASLEDLLTAAGDIGGRSADKSGGTSGGKDLGDALAGGDESSSEWPAIEDKKRDWPGL